MTKEVQLLTMDLIIEAVEEAKNLYATDPTISEDNVILAVKVKQNALFDIEVKIEGSETDLNYMKTSLSTFNKEAKDAILAITGEESVILGSRPRETVQEKVEDEEFDLDNLYEGVQNNSDKPIDTNSPEIVEDLSCAGGACTL